MSNLIVCILFILVVFRNVMAIDYYSSIEFAYIYWGDGTNEIKITAPIVNGIISDTTDYDIDPGNGPSYGFIDLNENIVIVSCGLNQLKVFSKSGELIYDILGSDTQIKRRIESQSVDEIYIDTLSHIYLTTFPGISIVPIIDYMGNIIDSLVPYADSGNIQIVGLSWSPSGQICFDELHHGYRRLYNNQILSGGSKAFLANDNKYYAALESPPTSIQFLKSTDPDSTGRPVMHEFKNIDYIPDTIEYATILSGGDGSKLFILVATLLNEQYTNQIWVYDLEYNLLATASFPQYESKYDRYLDPFVACDNSIYEFRCLDDGLHVIKWTKQ